MTYEYEQYLAHHGIKGQKWGRRRFQNLDGTLTEEGKRRYSEADSWQKDEASELSNEELDRRNNRMQKESQYRNNISNRHPVEREAAGIAKKVFVSSAVGVAAAATASKYKDWLGLNDKKKTGDAAAKAGESAAKKATEDAAKKVSEGAVKKSVSSGRTFLYNNRRLIGLGLGITAVKGTELWKKRNDEQGRSSMYSDFAYKHRKLLGVASYIAVNRIAKHLYKH